MAGPASPRAFAQLLETKAELLPPGLGGTPVNALVRELVHHGTSVHLLTLSPEISNLRHFKSDLLELTAVPWRPRPRQRALDFFRQEREFLHQVMARSSADVIHAHWTYEYALAAANSIAPVVVSIHDAPFTVLRHHRDAYRFVRYVMAARFRFGPETMLTAVSPYAAERWRRELWDRRHIEVIPNMVMPLGGCTSGPPTDSNVIVSIGSGDSLKNVSMAIDGFALFQRSSPRPYQLRLIGPGLGELEDLAQRTRLVHGDLDVEFLGVMSYGETQSQLRSACALIHPSREESLGMAILEAFQAGVPVVAGRASGAVPWVTGYGKAALLVDVSDPSAIAEGLATVVMNSEKRQALQLNADLLLNQRYSPHAVTSAYLKAYASLRT